MNDDSPSTEDTEPQPDAAEERRRLTELLREIERAKASYQAGGPGADARSSSSESQATPDWTPIVPIQPMGSKAPFFVVHAILGSVFPYHRLALALGANRPVYGLQSRGLDGRRPPIETIEEMARVYLEAVRTVQPSGPYHLGGYSMGGWIAYEMACRLRSVGEDVAVVAQLGTPAPLGLDAPGAAAWRWTTTYVDDFFSLWRNAALSDNSELRSTYFGEQGAGSNPFTTPGANPFGAPGAGPFGPGHPGAAQFAAGIPPVGPTYQVLLANVTAQMRYVANSFDGGVEVFLTSEQSALHPADPTMGWHSLCAGPVGVYHVDGNHLNLFKEPQVLELARILSQLLDGNAPEEEADG